MLSKKIATYILKFNNTIKNVLENIIVILQKVTVDHLSTLHKMVIVLRISVLGIYIIVADVISFPVLVSLGCTSIGNQCDKSNHEI